MSLLCIMKKAIDGSTEEKIKKAAKEVFHKKGYAATRTRDIAERAGINLALLNYYFRSKEKLFQLIMLETMQNFSFSLAKSLNDPDSTLNEKIESIVAGYIDLLVLEPDVPLFIMTEIRNQPDVLLSKLPFKQLIMQSVFAKQYETAVKAGKIPPLPLMHFMMNIMGMTVFPFIGSPLLKRIGNINETEFRMMMQERKKYIPIWLKSILKTKVDKK